MALLINGGLDKPPPRLAMFAIRFRIALTLKNTKAGGLQLFRVHLFRSTFDLVSLAMPKICSNPRRGGNCTTK